MLTDRARKLLIGLVVALCVAVLVCGLFSSVSPLSGQVSNAVTVIFLVTAIAAGIERTLEVFWTFAASRWGSAWPFKLVIDQLNDITGNLDSGLKTYQQRAERLVELATTLQSRTVEEITGAKQHVEKLKQLTTEIRTVAKDHTKLQMAVSAAVQHINFIEAKYAVVAEATAKNIAKGADGYTDPAKIEELGRELLKIAIDARVEDAMQSWTTKFRDDNKREPLTEEVTHQRDSERKLVEPKLTSEFNNRLGGVGSTPNLDQAKDAFSYAQLQVNQASGNISLGFDVASQAINGVTSFVASFKENPGKRAISLLAGAILGLVICGALGLDIFKAVQEDTSTQPQSSNNVAIAKTDAPPVANNPLESIKWGVILTGILVGLGSEPTHQVIKILQETKKSRRAENSLEVVSTDPTPTTTIVTTPSSSTPQSSAALVAEALTVAANADPTTAPAIEAVAKAVAAVPPAPPPIVETLLVAEPEQRARSIKLR